MGKRPNHIEGRTSSPQKSRAELTKMLAERTRELSDALEQEAATAEILRVISSAPADVLPVFETIARNAVALCGGLFANVFRYDGELLHYVASHQTGPGYVEMLRSKYPMRPDRSQVSGRVLLSGSVVRLEDARADPEYDQRFPTVMAWRRMLGVPMLRNGEVLGTIVVGWAEAGPVPAAQEDLLKTFADQAVIAIENARLLRELEGRNRELADALQQQTATSEVLKVISRSTFDLQPVLETLIENATRLCRADKGFIFRAEAGGLRLAVDYRAPPAFREWRSQSLCVPGDGSLVGRVAAEGRSVEILDAQADPAWRAHHAPAQGVGEVRSMIGVPMLREGVLLGVIAMWRLDVSPFNRKEIDLIQTFAEQAVIAIENVRLFSELQERTHELSEALEQQTATADVLKVISRSTVDLQGVLQTLVQTAAELCQADMVSVTRPRATDGAHYHVASHGFPPEWFDYMQSFPLMPDRGTLIGRTLLERQAIHIPDVLADREYTAIRAQQLSGMRAVLGVPLLREGATVGVFLIARRSPRAFTEKQIDLVRTFADQALIAIENARLFDEIQVKNRQLELANTSKSRFLAVASHDLRQPLHALNLFVAQLRAESDPAERGRLVARIDTAVSAMNELFDALLDISRLDAGVLAPERAAFPVARLLERVETTFAEAARAKGLRLRVVPSDAWVRSDFVLLERILLNLVSNAVRYTARGGVVVGGRRRGERLRIDVVDTGAGIPEDQQRNIFGEFYRLSAAHADRRGGLGLGLAIVDRLAHLLDHPVDLASRPQQGSRFSVSVPLTLAAHGTADAAMPEARIADPARGKLVVVVDDDALVLEGMQGILQSWGCAVVTAGSADAALAGLADQGRGPDLIISDYHLANGETGIEVIERLRRELGAAVPAFLISGDTAPDRLREARSRGYFMLHKPVSPMMLRAVLNRLLQQREAAPATGRPGARRSRPPPAAASAQADRPR
jgi:signal transduction histidine kinase/CheY-like chemotaxis protein